jgi:inosose dehydratase
VTSSQRKSIVERIAGAPISWGVSEAPDWGVQLSVDRVLSEMRDIDLAATELGPDGWLTEGRGGSVDVRKMLESFDLQLVGGFVCAMLHMKERHDEELATVAVQASTIAAAGGDVLVLAVVGGSAGYDEVLQLDDGEWKAIFAGIDRCVDLAAKAGLECVVHPHVGTTIETSDQVERLMEGSNVGICLDTGHLMIGGVDPVALAIQYPHRIRHVHLKDVNAALAERVRSGELSYGEAVTNGLYTPLGDGDVDFQAAIAALESFGYSGWYVLEQDVRLTAESDNPGRSAAASAAAIRDFTGFAAVEPAG